MTAMFLAELLVVIGLLTLAVGFGWSVGLLLRIWLQWLENRDRRQHKTSRPSVVEIELDAIRRAAHIRDVTTAAEAHMDDFIAQRAVEQQRRHANVVDGEVIDVRDQKREPRWPR